jgi:hypothetical protein
LQDFNLGVRVGQADGVGACGVGGERTDPVMGLFSTRVERMLAPCAPRAPTITAFGAVIAVYYVISSLLDE